MLQYRALLGQQWFVFLKVWGIVAPVWDQLCDTFGAVSGKLRSSWEQFESASKYVSACVRGYASRRPGIFYAF